MKTISAYIILIAVAITTIPPITKGVVAQAAVVPPVKLEIRAQVKNFVSGSAVSVVASFVNSGKLPFIFTQYYPAEFTFLPQAVVFSTNRPTFSTNFGRKCSKIIFVPRHWVPPVQLVMPGKSAQYFTSPRGLNNIIPIGRFLDLTLPDKYRIRLVTKYGASKWRATAKIVTTNGWVDVGNCIALDQDGAFVGHLRVGHGSIKSNLLKISVTAPYQKLPKGTLAHLSIAEPKLPVNTPAGIHIILIKPVATGPGPISIQAELFGSGKQPITRPFSGNPLADFGQIEVTGPSFLGESITVQKPKPHEVPYIHKRPAPLTAYGKWLAKHAPQNLKRHEYTLKPGIVYKYAEPINLSCMYDMSLSGVYRVRVRLKHSSIWSPWTNITIPQNW